MQALSSVSLAGITYYDKTPEAFLAAQVGRGPVKAAQRLAAQLSHGSRVVDAGCGTGVEARFFAQNGFEVYAYDASETMVREARAAGVLNGMEVHRHAHHELSLRQQVQGIYAGASLLFLEPADLEVALEVFAWTLAEGGLLSLSFKAGTGRREEASTGRVFHNYLPGDASRLADLCGLDVHASWLAPDALGRGTEWTCIELRKGE